MTTKENILKALSAKTFIPYEINGTPCTLRVWSGTDMDIWEKHNKENEDDTRALFCSLTIGDENGNKLFSKSDIAELGKVDFRLLDKIIEDGLKLNKVSNDDIRVAEKN